jgi:hypothetical protein
MVAKCVNPHALSGFATLRKEHFFELTLTPL